MYTCRYIYEKRHKWYLGLPIGYSPVPCRRGQAGAVPASCAGPSLRGPSAPAAPAHEAGPALGPAPPIGNTE